jgi:hypothetical protein
LQNSEDENGEGKQLPPEVQQMIEQCKMQIEEMTKQIQLLESENDDKEDELRLKKYEIDVKAEIEFAKLAKDAGMPLEQVMQIVNNALSNAAQQPELPEEGEQFEQEPQMMQPQFEQDETMLSDDGQMMDEQMAMDMGGGIDVSQLEQLPDVQQEQSFD